MTRVSESLGRIAISAIGWLAIVYLALPLVVIICVSFTTTEYLRFPPVGFTWRWYTKFLTDYSYLDAIWTSGSLAVVSTACALVLGLPVALVIARARFPGRNALNALFLSPLILPGVVIGAAVLQYAAALGIARTYTAMLAGHIVIVIPYIVRTTLASLSGFSESIDEAARDLGASGPTAFFLVTLPAIKPGVIAGALFSVIISWINVELSIFNTTAQLMTIPVKLFNYVQYSVDPMIAAVSAATIYVAVIVVVAMDLMVGIDKATTTNAV